MSTNAEYFRYLGRESPELNKLVDDKRLSYDERDAIAAAQLVALRAADMLDALHRIAAGSPEALARKVIAKVEGRVEP